MADGMHVLTILTVAVSVGSTLIAQPRSASITGRVQDVTAAGVRGVDVDLRSEDDEGHTLSTTRTDAFGTLDISNLPKGNYVLRLFSPGFQLLTIRSIHVLDGERKVLPTLELSIGEPSCGRARAVLDYVRLLTPSAGNGNVVGTVRVDPGPVGTSPPVENTEVSLLCSGSTPCSTTKTDAQGRFLLTNVPSGEHAIRASHAGFYSETLAGYVAQDRREMVYFPLYIERCFAGNCDPAKRPEKPPAICE